MDTTVHGADVIATIHPTAYTIDFLPPFFVYYLTPIQSTTSPGTTGTTGTTSITTGTTGTTSTAGITSQSTGTTRSAVATDNTKISG